VATTGSLVSGKMCTCHTRSPWRSVEPLVPLALSTYSRALDCEIQAWMAWMAWCGSIDSAWFRWFQLLQTSLICRGFKDHPFSAADCFGGCHGGKKVRLGRLVPNSYHVTLSPLIPWRGIPLLPNFAQLTHVDTLNDQWSFLTLSLEMSWKEWPLWLHDLSRAA